MVSWDSDGTLAKFDELAWELTRTPKPITPAEITAWWDKLAARPSLFADLAPYADMVELVKTVRPLVAYTNIITGKPRRSTFPNAEQDKRDWFAKHVDSELEVIVCYASVKQKFIRREFDAHLLIDDLPSNIKRWEDAGGTGILHTDYASTVSQLRNFIEI